MNQSTVGESKSTEIALTEDERTRLFSLIGAVSTPLFLKDSTCQLVAINAACEKLWGVKLEDLIGRSNSRYAGGDIQGYMDIDQEIFVSKISKEIEEVFSHNEKKIRLRTTKTPIYYSNGKPMFLVCSTQKRTEQKSPEGKEERLMDAILQLQRLGTLGTVVVGIMKESSEIHVTIEKDIDVIGLIANQISKGLDGGLARLLFTRIDSIKSASKKGSDTLQSLVDFGTKGDGVKKSVCVATFIKEAVKVLSLMPSFSLRIEVDRGLWVRGNSIELRQIIINLCFNALMMKLKKNDGECKIKVQAISVDVNAMTSKGIYPTLSDGKYVRISVSEDEGAGVVNSKGGVSREIANNLFVRVAIKALGADFSLLESTVASHGGGVEVESFSDSGEYFNIYLPIFASENFPGNVRPIDR